MSEGLDMKLHNNLEFRHKKFTVPEEEVGAVVLNEKQILDLYKHDFGANRRLDQVRDLFAVGCCTGLRCSDYSNIKPENIVQDEDGNFFVKMRTQKSGEIVIIPVNPIVKANFEKYSGNNNQLPRSISDQRFNSYIKEACEKVGLVGLSKLANKSKEKLKLYECISSHTARRSFATNLYNEGFPIYALMKITGHRTEKAFRNYIKVSQEESANRLELHNKKKDWSRLMLRVAG